MKQLMTYSIQKIVTQALIICFLAIILPIMTTAQSNVPIDKITHVYYGDPGNFKPNLSANNYIQWSNPPRSQPQGDALWGHNLWHSGAPSTHQNLYMIARDANAIYLSEYETQFPMIDYKPIRIPVGDVLIIDVANNRVGWSTNGATITSEIGKILKTENSLSELSWEETRLINQQEHEANRAYTLTQPVVDADLNAIMVWIGQETSRHSVDFCWKDSYPRKTYNNQKECEDKENGECVKLGLFWYVRCIEGYETSVVPNCLMKCPSMTDVGNGAQNVKTDCGLLCSLDNCVEGVTDMVFAPINMALSIATLGLTGAAQNTAKQAAIAGVNAGTAGATKAAMAGAKWHKLYKALEMSESVLTPLMDAKDRLEYLYNTVQDLETEINRWNGTYESDFSELTHYTVNTMINNRFPDPDDRAFIKRAYGKFQLTALTEADGWRIAKTVMAAASIEPTGIVATINAFSHPVCKLTPYPFPNIRIIPKSERYKVYPEVKFHSQQSLNLTQARSIAKSNSWTLASETEIRNAWNVGQLNVYGYGMLSNGKFAVPTQTDKPNFKKGPNIGAIGGNQGFFYTLGLHEVVLPPAATPLPLVSNTIPPGYESSTPVEPGKITNVALGKSAKQSSNYSAGPGKTFPANNAVDGVKEGYGKISHTLQEAGAWWEVDLGGSYNISSIKVYNAADIPQRMNDFTILVSETPFTGNSGGTAFVANQKAPTPTESYSGNAKGRYVRLFLNGTNYLTIHEIEIFGTQTPPAASPITPVGDGFVRIQNSWYKNNYINNQNGKIEQGTIEPNWWSAQWKIIPVHSGWVRIQNRWYPDRYLHNQNGKLEVGKIQNNWASAMWKLVPAHSGWVRIQNSWYKEHYIHNQNGKIELGPIQNNWASALWKVE